MIHISLNISTSEIASFSEKFRDNIEDHLNKAYRSVFDSGDRADGGGANYKDAGKYSGIRNTRDLGSRFDVGERGEYLAKRLQKIYSEAWVEWHYEVSKKVVLSKSYVRWKQGMVDRGEYWTGGKAIYTEKLLFTGYFRRSIATNLTRASGKYVTLPNTLLYAAYGVNYKIDTLGQYVPQLLSWMRKHKYIDSELEMFQLGDEGMSKVEEVMTTAVEVEFVNALSDEFVFFDYDELPF